MFVSTHLAARPGDATTCAAVEEVPHGAVRIGNALVVDCAVVEPRRVSGADGVLRLEVAVEPVEDVGDRLGVTRRVHGHPLGDVGHSLRSAQDVDEFVGVLAFVSIVVGEGLECDERRGAAERDGPFDQIAVERVSLERLRDELVERESERLDDERREVVLEVLHTDLVGVGSRRRRDQEVDRDLLITPTPPLADDCARLLGVGREVLAAQPRRDLLVVLIVEYRDLERDIEVVGTDVRSAVERARVDGCVADHRCHEAADDAQFVGEVPERPGQGQTRRDHLSGLLRAITRRRRWLVGQWRPGRGIAILRRCAAASLARSGRPSRSR
jgi:hypothetical protein